MTGPLAGLRILELPAIGPAPFCGGLLADLGADVIRIDRLADGDPGFAVPRRFDVYNRNKRSVALDLKDAEAVALALRMVARADVLIEGFRPGVAERLGLGPERCLEVNPRLVYGRMTGWGQEGPLRNVVGHDINYLALTGALLATGDADRPPTPPLNLVADLGGGAMYLAVGILSALHEAKSSGRGQVVDAAMIDGVSHLMSAFHAFRQHGSWSVERGSNVVDGGAPFYATYETADGKFVAVGAIEPRFYAELLRAVGLAEADDLPGQYDRAAWPLMRERFARIFRSRPRAEWVDAMEGHDACFSPVLDMEEALAHPQMRERGVFADLDGVTHPAPAPRFGRTPGSLRHATPEPGQDGRRALADWGLTEADIAAAQASGALLAE